MRASPAFPWGSLDQKRTRPERFSQQPARDRSTAHPPWIHRTDPAPPTHILCSCLPSPTGLLPPISSHCPSPSISAYHVRGGRTARRRRSSCSSNSTAARLASIRLPHRPPPSAPPSPSPARATARGSWGEDHPHQTLLRNNCRPRAARISTSSLPVTASTDSSSSR